MKKPQHRHIETVANGKLRIFGTCSVTGEEYSVTVDHDRWKRWKEGALIQDVLPDLDADQREFLITGLTHAEWRELFDED